MSYYIEKMGKRLPPKGTIVKINYMEGLKWYIIYINCPHLENIIEGWISTKEEALNLCKKLGFFILNNPNQLTLF